MAPRHTRIVALLLLLAIHAVGVLSLGPSTSWGTDYVPEVHKQMFDEAEKRQTEALLEREHTYFSRGPRDFSSKQTFVDRALDHAKQRGVRFVGTDGQELYFYSIIQPHNDLGKDIGLEPKPGRYGYVSFLWEYNKNWKNPKLIRAFQAFSVPKDQDRSFHWQMKPFNEVLKLVPK
ncbi:hypothetical protein NDA18_005549 [Ustilago nuda]|nr:hypothetical protein NDA18_005549 [Ustilago nuda]